MVLGQRGRRAPQGKPASNLSITDLSYRAWADMRWGNLHTDSRMLLCVAMGIYHQTIRTSPWRANVPLDMSESCSLVMELKRHWTLLSSDLLIFNVLKAVALYWKATGGQYAMKIATLPHPPFYFLLSLLFYFNAQHYWLQIGARKGHLFFSGELSWWRGMTFRFGQVKGMKVSLILDHQNTKTLIHSSTRLSVFNFKIMNLCQSRCWYCMGLSAMWVKGFLLVFTHLSDHT